MTDQALAVRRMPIWLSAAVIVACLAGGGLLIYWYAFGLSGSGGEVVVLDRDPSDSVRKAGADSWIVNSGSASLTISNATSKTRKPTLELVFRRLDGLNSDQIRYLSAMRRIASDAHMRETLAITPEQLDQIHEIRNGAKVALTDRASATLMNAFQTYHEVTDPKGKDAAETQLINALEEVARPLEDGAAKSGIARAAQAAKLLTAEQWSQYAQFGK